MAINWGSTVGDYGRLGLNITTSNVSETITRVTTEVWFWSKYSVSDSNNVLYFDYGKTAATTSKGSVPVNTTNNSGGWSTANQIKLATYTYDYARTTNNQTGYCSAKLANIEVVGGAMSVSGSFPVPAKPTYSITYNANGGSGAPGKQSYTYASSGATYLSSIKPTRTGYTFLGWSLSSSATTASYSAGQAWGLNNAGNYILYAVWKLNTYTITYDTNGGSTASWTETKKYGSGYLSTTVPTRTNYEFLGWSTSANATTAMYASGGAYTVISDVKLYAVWKLIYIKPRITGLSIDRCDVNGDLTDEGTYALVRFDWRCDNAVTNIKVSWSSTSAGSGSKGISASGTNGSINEIVGGELSADSTYTVTVNITDTESTERSLTLNGTMFPIDVLPGGKGVAIGKPAETEGLFDIAFSTLFNKPVYGNVRGLSYLPKIPSGTNLNNWRETGAWAIESYNLGSTILNMPPCSCNAGILEVSNSVGNDTNTIADGWIYITQTFIPLDSIYPTYSRTLTKKGSDQDWDDGKWYSCYDRIYPVNSIYISYSHTSPASLFGGTWTRIAGRFLWGVNENNAIGHTAGETEHTLTLDEIPYHTHDIYNANSGGANINTYPVQYSGTKKGYVGNIATGGSGGGKAHNNMPPYIMVSIWRRTA